MPVMKRAMLLLLVAAGSAHAIDKKYAGKGLSEAEACKWAKEEPRGSAERISDCSCRLTGTVDAKGQPYWRCEITATFKSRKDIPINDWLD